MFFRQRFIPGLAIYSYLIGDEKTRECAVIDPARDVDTYFQMAREEGMQINHILETHVHADYVSGSVEVKHRTGGKALIHSSGMGGKEWTPPYADHVVRDGDEVVMGSIRLKALHTPGHTPEHLVWLVFDNTRSSDTPWMMFSGDFLFVGDVGRPDLLGEEARKQLASQLYQSVFKKMPPLADFTEFYPGHGAGSLCGKALGTRGSSTLGFERRFNDALKASSEPAWINQLLDGMPTAPPYFLKMKAVNAAGPKVLGHEWPGQRRFSAKQFQAQTSKEGIILDMRSKEAFAAAHIPKALSIPLGQNASTWAGWVLPYDQPLYLVLEDMSKIQEAITHLIRIGFDNIQGTLEGGMEAWENAGLPVVTLSVQSVHNLYQQLKKKDTDLTVLDVRTPREWQGGHIEGAKHIHAGLLQKNLASLNRQKPVAVVCGTGYRASIAGSILLREGFSNVTNVLGGMTAWKAAELPTVCEGTGAKCQA